MIDSWSHDEEEGRERAHFGRWRVIEENEDRSLFAGDEGELTAMVVGGLEYGNEHVAFHFTPDGFDVGEEVVPFEDIDAL